MSNKTIYRRGVIPKEAVNSQTDSSEDEESMEEVEVQGEHESALVDSMIPKFNNSKIPGSPKSEEVKELERRARIREKLLASRRTNGEIQKKNIEPEHDIASIGIDKGRDSADDSEEEESESDEESEDSDEFPKRVLFKPVFVPKKARETVIDLSKAELEKIKQQDESQKLMEEHRIEEAKEAVIEALRKEAAEEAQKLVFIELDDTDDLDPEAEMTEWKIRELMRIKRDRELREFRLVDDEDIERRRNMTNEQIASENKKDGKLEVEKQSQKFMQKYYHKGAFYSGDLEVEEALRRVDASAPTLEDHQDKIILPDVMRVKNFGKSGRTKYTHLVDQDTTGLDTAWAKSENLGQNVLKRMGGINSGFDKPVAKKNRNH